MCSNKGCNGAILEVFTFFYISKQNKSHYSFKILLIFRFGLSPLIAWLRWSWTPFSPHSKQMFKSLHSAHLHLNWRWLSHCLQIRVHYCSFCTCGFFKQTLLIKPYLCEKHPEAQYHILRDGSAFKNTFMKGEYFMTRNELNPKR